MAGVPFEGARMGYEGMYASGALTFGNLSGPGGAGKGRAEADASHCAVCGTSHWDVVLVTDTMHRECMLQTDAVTDGVLGEVSQS